MENMIINKYPEGVPEGYVEYIRPISKRSVEVRKAYVSVELKKRTRTRTQLSADASNEEANAIRAALGL